MDYQQTIDFLFSQLPVFQREGKAAYKDNLDNTLALDAYFNHPHKKFKTIHVAGTNGKGSVSHMIASVLQETGLKTGLYTSPHLTDFRERIKVNGKMMDKASVVDFVGNHKNIIEDLKPSFFELTVAMAFNYFAQEKVDVAVIEVGMGGRLDSTNIINPVLSIITNIGLDHTQFLGNTLELIAKEKAGIIKDRVPVIVGAEQAETLPVFVKIASEKSAPLCIASKRFYISKSGIENNFQLISVKNKQSGTTLEVELDLLGNYQKDNLLTVMAAMQILIPLFDIPKSTVVTGLKNVVKNTGLRGRWQVIQKTPLVICDTGHNFDGIAFIVKQLANQTYDKLHVVFGMVNDKDPSGVLNLLPRDAIYYFAKASIPRALNHEELREMAKRYNLIGDSYSTVADAVEAAKRQLNEKDLLFIGGSTFVVADFLGGI
ncbi:MAG: folylpolyglutamate synthase/dihydrofolate synthase family protein [Salinivirgaceae bacterium]